MKTLYLCLSLLLYLITGSCQNEQIDPVKNEILTGTWIATFPITANQVWTVEYTFSSNDHVLQRSYRRDPTTGQITGHLSRLEGTYELRGQDLLIRNVTLKRSGGEWVPENQLADATPDDALTSAYIIFDTNKTSFYRSISCPPNATCVGPNYFFKQ